MDLAIDGVSIQIKFVGLLDAVSSAMSEEAGELIGMVPYLGMIKTSYKDRRAYQPVCSVVFILPRRTRCALSASRQSREDPRRAIPLSGYELRRRWRRPKGFAWLQRRVDADSLRDMLLEALKAGAVMDTMEDLRDKKPDTFRKFTIAQPINADGKQYRIKQLVDAYYAPSPQTRRRLHGAFESLHALDLGPLYGPRIPSHDR